METYVPLFVGSCSDDRYGIGTLIVGQYSRSDFRSDEFDGIERPHKQVLCKDSGLWIDCYDVMEFKQNSNGGQ
jgi:hypothetical protein